MRINIIKITAILFAVLTVSLISQVNCRADEQNKDKAEFEKLYKDWHNEAQEIRFSSRTDDYLRLPSFQKIVALGQKALPYIKDKLEINENDFMLAHAIIQIKGWDLKEFGNYSSEQELRSRVLQRMK